MRLNPDAVKGNSNVPPADCQCDLDEDGCFLYDDISYLNSTTSFNFTAWEDVRAIFIIIKNNKLYFVYLFLTSHSIKNVKSSIFDSIGLPEEA